MQWIRLGERKGDFLKNCLLYESVVENFYSVIGVQYCDLLTLRNADTFIHYHDAETSKKLSKFVWQKLYENPYFLADIFEQGKHRFEELMRFAEYAGMQKTNYKEIMARYFQLYKAPYPHFLITLFADDIEKEYIDQMADFRLFARKSFNRTHEFMLPLLEEVSRQYALHVEELKFLRPAEILLLLDGASFDLKRKIMQRRQCYFLFQKQSFELKENSTYAIEEQFSDILQGMGTSCFVYTGKVKIITSKQDAEKIEQGDVIVTRMTTPDLITPLFQKAGALITDEGGITCHAAVVSREFKLPALVGTKNATKVLKDGDIVEVDAKTGIVRKIS